MKALGMFLMMAVFIGQAASAAELNCTITRNSNSYRFSPSETDTFTAQIDMRGGSYHGQSRSILIAAGTVDSYLMPHDARAYYSIELLDMQTREKRLALGVQSLRNGQWIDSQNVYGQRLSQAGSVTSSFVRGSYDYEITCDVQRGFDGGFDGGPRPRQRW